MDEGQAKGWRQEQAREFGRRLQWARMRAGYSTRRAVIDAMPDEWGIAPRTYYSHERGERTPERDDTLKHYCEMFNVSREFLLFGTGTELAEFSKAESHEIAEQINHTPNQVYEKSSKLEAVRYIPIIRASNIEKIISGKGTLANMTKEFLPVSSSLLAGPRSFGYEIASEDDSMIGDGGKTFSPGSHVVADPDREIMPGKYLLVQFPGMDPTVRQLQAGFSYKPDAPRFPFTLKALNPRFDPVTIGNADECVILGRVVFTIEEL
jgi:SOS-response transcriptional repressor LexA